MHPSTWHLEKADGKHDWLHVCRSLRHCISWIGKRGGIDGVRRFGARVPKSLVRRSLAFGNAQVARRPENLKLARRSWQCSAGRVTTRTVDSRWKNYEKLYGTKVSPLAEAKYQNKYKKRKKTNRLQLTRRGAQYTDEMLGWRAETEISVRTAHGDTISALLYKSLTGVKIGGSRIRP
jgi:hypothetical protein